MQLDQLQFKFTYMKNALKKCNPKFQKEKIAIPKIFMTKRSATNMQPEKCIQSITYKITHLKKRG